MKRVFTILFALSIAFTANSSIFTLNVDAAKKKQAAEATTEAGVNLSDQEEGSQFTNLPATGASYQVSEYEDAPDITAASAILMDARSGAVLYAKEADTKRYPASITKVMTTLLAIENGNLNDVITFSKEAVYGIEAGSSSAGIPVGAELTVEETLYALMLVSANEAGAAIAEHVAGSNEAFAELMTERAKALGCTGTQFRNPHGLPDEEHYTTAHDMGLIMQECIKHEEFRRISSTINYEISKRDSLPSAIPLTNHAKILRSSFPEYYYEYAVGAKTGFTHAALNTLVTFAEKDGVQLLCVILKDQGADCSYYDTKALYEWGFKKVKTIYPLEKFNLNEALSSDESFKEKEVNAWLELNPEFVNDFPILVPIDFDPAGLSASFRLKEDPKTGRLGFIDLKSGDEKVFSAPVTYDTQSAAGQEYLSKQGGEDNLKTVETKNKNSILHRMMVFLLRLALACVLIFIIMQLIHRYQLKKQREERMKARNNRKNSGKYQSVSSTGKTNRSTASGRASSSKKSSGTGKSTARSSGTSRKANKTKSKSSANNRGWK